ncbi:hypothetical protein LWI28_025979 [Acer negundo]|uniref:Uncharacterized protein n=1 Tax=Acer negundo TaxID=4023 RepID=A0AAD5IHB0_ACENE|nr:hypothetical protein LWI28_025979 [Acer negundo]
MRHWRERGNKPEGSIAISGVEEAISGHEEEIISGHEEEIVSEVASFDDRGPNPPSVNHLLISILVPGRKFLQLEGNLLTSEVVNSFFGNVIRGKSVLSSVTSVKEDLSSC